VISQASSASGSRRTHVTSSRTRWQAAPSACPAAPGRRLRICVRAVAAPRRQTARYRRAEVRRRNNAKLSPPCRAWPIAGALACLLVLFRHAGIRTHHPRATGTARSSTCRAATAARLDRISSTRRRPHGRSCRCRRRTSCPPAARMRALMRSLRRRCGGHEASLRSGPRRPAPRCRRRRPRFAALPPLALYVQHSVVRAQVPLLRLQFAHEARGALRDAYVDALLADLGIRLPRSGAARRHRLIGGGTPSLFAARRSTASAGVRARSRSRPTRNHAGSESRHSSGEVSRLQGAAYRALRSDPELLRPPAGLGRIHERMRRGGRRPALRSGTSSDLMYGAARADGGRGRGRCRGRARVRPRTCPSTT